jgi:hypothetical protein
MEQPKDIPIISVSIQVPGITQYLATKEIYPSASQNPAQATPTKDSNSNSNSAATVPPEKKPKI